MKLFLMSLMLGAIPPWVAAAVACPKHAKCEVRAATVKVDADKADTDASRFVLTADSGAIVAKVRTPDSDPPEEKIVTVTVGGDAKDGRSEPHALTIVGPGEKKDRGYLGVSIAKVPKALNEQLDLEGRGIVVQNVVKGSPADLAGIKKHDVLLAIDGHDITDGVSDAGKLIAAHEPGDEVTVVVLRDGKKSELAVTLGSRTNDDAKFEWKFEVAPDAEVEDEVHTFGRMLRKDDEGNWVLENLGDLDELKNLPKNLLMFVPKGGNRSLQIFSEGGHKKIKVKAEREGELIIVEQDDDEIEVTRVDEDGHKTEATYDSMDELREADEEAADLLESTDQSVGIHIDLDDDDAITGINLDALGDLDFDFPFDSDDWKERMGEWRETLEKSLDSAREAQKEALAEVHELMEKLREQGTLSKNAKIKELPELLRQGKGLGVLARLGKPKHSFTVGKDGTIEVRIRRGDSELVQRFENADDLERRKPALFKKYQRLIETDNDEE